MTRKARRPSTPAAAYIRMSGRQQKPPAEQRAEVAKLAEREGYGIVEWFSDEAISGDTTTDDRDGLRDLLEAAQAGKFKVLLTWHTNRISREEPMDAIGFYNQLRKAGVALHTCVEGAIDLEDFPKQLLLFVNQKASNDYLTELAAKSLRGRIAIAKIGEWPAGNAPYGMDRGEFDAKGKLIRRLAKGDRRNRANRLRLLPCTDSQKLEAIQYAFQRADAAHLSPRQLARELQMLGYPPPRGNGWTRTHVVRILTTPAYAGISRFGKMACGTYYEARREEIIRCKKRKGKARRKADEETIYVAGAHAATVPVELFTRVYAKLKRESPKERRRANDRYPLSGLLACGHCGRKMVSHSTQFRNSKGAVAYKYQTYICSSSTYYGKADANNKTCGCQTINADRALEWLVYKLREIYLGPGRPALVERIREKLTRPEKPRHGESDRLQKRLEELERQTTRLVNAIRTTDAPELADELAATKAERDTVKATLEKAKKPTARRTPEAEAEHIADQLRKMRQQLTGFDPATLREVLRRLAAKIECQWDTKTGKRNTYRLREVKVYLRNAERGDARGIDCPADIESGLVTFHEDKQAEPADCANALADLLISAWEARDRKNN